MPNVRVEIRKLRNSKPSSLNERKSLKKTGRIAECRAHVSKFRENNSGTNSRNLLFVIPSLSPSDAKQNRRSIHMATMLKGRVFQV
jgi:hypothetical protein